MITNFEIFESYYGKEYIYDIRNFFSNIITLSYYYKDYYKFIDLFDLIKNQINENYTMPFFGFTNDSESQFNPIIDKVTIELHKMLPLAFNKDYESIYNYVNNTQLYGFEKNYGRNLSFSVETYISKELEKSLNFLTKPFFRTSFYSHKNEKNVNYEKIKEITSLSNLNKKYNIKVWKDSSKIEVTLIMKEKPTLNSEELEEIKRSKEYGQKKYDYLKPLVGIHKNVNKYNI